MKRCPMLGNIKLVWKTMISHVWPSLDNFSPRAIDTGMRQGEITSASGVGAEHQVLAHLLNPERG